MAVLATDQSRGATLLLACSRYTVPYGSFAVPEYSCQRSDQYSNIADYNSYAQASAEDTSVDWSIGVKANGIFSSGVDVDGGYGHMEKGSEGSKKAQSESRQSDLYRFDSRSCA